MDLDDWQNNDTFKLRWKPKGEHYVPTEPNELEKATIEARQQGMTYGKWQQLQTIKKLKEDAEREKKLAERRKKF